MGALALVEVWFSPRCRRALRATAPAAADMDSGGREAAAPAAAAAATAAPLRERLFQEPGGGHEARRHTLVMRQGRNVGLRASEAKRRRRATAAAAAVHRPRARTLPSTWTALPVAMHSACPPDAPRRVSDALTVALSC